MSIKHAIPAVFAGITLVLTTTSYKSDDYHFDSEMRKPHIAYPIRDALRVHFDTRVHKLQEPFALQQIPDFLLATRIQPHVVETTALRNGVRYVMSNGENIERRGGTIAWRNNNPGCIRYSEQAVELGATGKANGFAVFPDEETGMRAIESLLKTEKYRDLTIGAAITRYAPPHENNTEGYIANLCRMTGLSNTLKIRDLNHTQMIRVVNAIRTIEGWREGSETTTPAEPTPTVSMADYYRSLKQQSIMPKPEHTL